MKISEEGYKRLRDHRKNVAGIRLFYALADGSEHIRDFAAVSEARENVSADMVDWVIFELVHPGRYACCGSVLDSSEAPCPAR